jgi:predicted transcriptional regulator
MVALLAEIRILRKEVYMAAMKKTMTLNLSDREMEVLEELAERKELSKTAVVRQALRLYQMIEARFDRGEKLYFEDDKEKKGELVVL